MAKKSIILDGAVLKLKRRLLDGDDDVAARVALARAFFLRSMHEEAIEAGRRVLEADPHEDRAWHDVIRATFFLDERRIPALREEFLEKTRGSAGEPWCRRCLALLHHYGGEEELAAEILEDLVAAQDGDSRAWEILGTVNFDAGRLDDALRCLDRAIELDGKNVTAYHLLGTCHYRGRDADKTVYYYQKAIQLEDRFARAWISLGEFFLKEEGSYAKAIQCFGTALSINPRNWDTYFFLVDHYIQHRLFELALAECHRILALDPGEKIRAEAHNYMGYIQFTQGLYDEAKASFKQAVKIDEGFASPYQNLGLLYMSLRDVDRARIYFKRAISLDPSISWSHTKLGFIYLDERVVERAEHHFRKARENDPEDFWPLLGLAEVSRLRRRNRKQLDYCKQAATLEPENTNVWNHLGIAYECNREYGEAETAYKRAMELDPYNRWAANNLGYLYEKLLKREGDDAYRTRAIETWKTRLQICARTGTSTQGAINHLTKLGIPSSKIEAWLEE